MTTCKIQTIFSSRSTEIFQEAFRKHDLELLETFLEQKDNFNVCFLPKMEVRNKRISGSIRYLYATVYKTDFFLRLARDDRFKKHLKSIGLFRFAVQKKAAWPVIKIFLQRQSTFEQFFKAAYYETCYPHQITHFDHFFPSSQIEYSAWREKRKRRELFKLINVDAVAIGIGLAQLDLPCFLLTSMVKRVCQPWSNTVHHFYIWTACSIILEFKLRLKEETKIQLAIAKKRVSDLEEQFTFLETWIAKTHKTS